LLLCFYSLILNSQADLRSWTTVQLDYKANDRLNIKLRPIVRHKDDLSNYNNTSIDFSLHYKLNQHWSMMLLERHFFIPDKGDREFLFFDVTRKDKLSSKLAFSNRFRYHLGLNLTNLDPDFIRYQPTLSLKTNKAFSPFVATDLFYRIETVNELAGARYILGFNYKVLKKVNFNFQYWRQVGYNQYPLFNAHILVLTATYKLNPHITKNQLETKTMLKK